MFPAISYPAGTNVTYWRMLVVGLNNSAKRPSLDGAFPLILFGSIDSLSGNHHIFENVPRFSPFFWATGVFSLTTSWLGCTHSIISSFGKNPKPRHHALSRATKPHASTLCDTKIGDATSCRLQKEIPACLSTIGVKVATCAMF